MSKLIVLIRHETDTRRFQRTPEDTTPKQEPRGYQVGPGDPTCRPPGPWGHPSTFVSLCRFPTASYGASPSFLK
jgi:hypothetical protein